MQEITDYYAGISAALAEGFVDELEAALQDLCDEPHIGSRRYAHLLADRSLRSWHLDRFPFIAFYRVEPSGIDLVRVLHERRDLSPALISV